MFQVASVEFALDPAVPVVKLRVFFKSLGV